MNRRDRAYQEPHFALPRVLLAALGRDVIITRRATQEAEAAFPADSIDLDAELRGIVRSLVPEEFQFAQRQTNSKGAVTWVDVYRIDFEGCDIWLKIKLESDRHGEYVVIISCHEWDENIPI